MKRGHCHPERAKRGEGPLDCKRRARLARSRELQLPGFLRFDLRISGFHVFLFISDFR